MKRNWLIMLVLAVSILTFSGCQSSSMKSDAASLGSNEAAAKDTANETTAEAGAADDSAAENAGEDQEIVEIKEKMFLTQTNEIYLNPKDYIGKTVQYEGLYYTYEYNDKEFRYVIRYGPGCCGNDGYVGFEVVCEDGQYPRPDDWVKVTGVLESYMEDDYEYLRVRVQSLEVLDERGQDTVTQ